jgi:tetratricopeptide (TPR) repeat protein
MPLQDPPHVDLLHPARRLWKRRLESCALTSLEGSVLGVRRSNEDVPGWVIPSLYFRYLRSGDSSEMRRVFYHNAHDVLSLAALAIHVSRVVGDPMCDLVTHGVDLLSLGRLYERVAQIETAISCYEESLQREMPFPERAEAMLRLAILYRRDQRWESCLAIWDRLVELGGPAAVQGLVERAKYYEHVERDYLEALDDVQRALRLCDLVGDSTENARIDLEHRQSRLINRVYRHRSWTGR